MAKRSAITQLPPDIKSWLNAALAEGNFSGYEALAEELKALGYGISKSAVHRYGQKLEMKLAAIKASTEAAKAIAEAAPDDADLRSSAVISLVQTETFDVLVRLQEVGAEDDPSERVKILGKVAKSVAELSRASVNQKKWQMQMEEKVRNEERAKAAEDATKAAKQSGASQDTIRLIREALGVK